MRNIVLCVPISTIVLTTLSSALEREMRHIVLCVSISTNELTTVSSALEREMRHIVLCAFYFYECANVHFLSIGRENETHCSMCLYFYE